MYPLVYLVAVYMYLVSATKLLTRHYGDIIIIIIIIIILFVQNKKHIKLHMDKISEQDNKALRSALTAALSTIICIHLYVFG